MGTWVSSLGAQKGKVKMAIQQEVVYNDDLNKLYAQGLLNTTSKVVGINLWAMDKTAWVRRVIRDVETGARVLSVVREYKLTKPSINRVDAVRCPGKTVSFNESWSIFVRFVN